MITVIADDITGAAEIAGIAKSAGFNTKLLMFGTTLPIENSKPSSLLLKTNSTLPNEVLVFATDTRQMSEAAAVREIEALLDRIGPESLLFKKTDSVLRGNISAECDAILRKTAYEQVLLVPQNPTKGRVVRGGLYYINNVLLTETQFADDPEFPARTAEVASFGVPDAENEEQIMQLVAAVKPKTLFAGGADLFRVIVQQLSPPPPPPTGRESLKDSLAQSFIHKRTNFYSPSPCGEGRKGGELPSFLMVCGSTQSKSVIETPFCKRLNAKECNMPLEVFLGKNDATAWIAELKELFPKHGLVLTINYPSQGGKDFAVRLRCTMAAVVKALVAANCNEKTASSSRLKLIIEGGATAFEILSQLGWYDFEVVKEHFPGVVEIENEHASIVLKPGSYPWNGLLDNDF